MPRCGNKIHIPLGTDEPLRLAVQLKPTKDMRRRGATGKKKATKPAIKKRKKDAH